MVLRLRKGCRAENPPKPGTEFHGLSPLQIGLAALSPIDADQVNEASDDAGMMRPEHRAHSMNKRLRKSFAFIATDSADFLCIRTSRFPERATGDDPHLLQHRQHRRHAASRRKPLLTSMALQPSSRLSTRRNFPSVNSRENNRILYFGYVVFSIPVKCCARAQPPQDPAQRAKLPGEIAKTRRHAFSPRQAPSHRWGCHFGVSCLSSGLFRPNNLYASANLPDDLIFANASMAVEDNDACWGCSGL